VTEEARTTVLTPLESAPRRRVLVIVNPHATAVSDRLRTVVLSALASRFELEAVTTRASDHATELARGAASAGYELVVALGGDGTVNEVVNGLAGSATPLTPLPGGSANVFCKLLGIPGEIVDATAHLLGLADAWRVRTLDLARANGRYYTFSAGVGIDASVVRVVDARPELKARFGPSFFTAAALWTVARRYLRDAPRMRVSTEDQAFTGITAIVQNGRHYTYFHDHPIELATGASLDGGQLAGAVLRRGSLIDLPSLLWRGASRSRAFAGHRQVDAFTTATGVRVEAIDGRPLPLQLDGDYVGEFERVEFDLQRRALSVVC
jgi:diacylglycerol kinase family enzyme